MAKSKKKKHSSFSKEMKKVLRDLSVISVVLLLSFVLITLSENPMDFSAVGAQIASSVAEESVQGCLSCTWMIWFVLFICVIHLIMLECYYCRRTIRNWIHKNLYKKTK